MTAAGRIYVDLETRSGCDLPRCGGWRYAEDPTTEVLCGVAVVEREPGAAVDAYAWTPLSLPEAEDPGADWAPPPEAMGALRLAPDAVRWHPVEAGVILPPAPVLDAAADGLPLVAHNAEGFDRPVWLSRGWPEPPGGWIDTADLARRHVLPGSLDGLARRLYGLGKDRGDVALTRLLSRPYRRPGRRRTQVDPSAAPRWVDPCADGRLAQLIRYCARDVLMMACAYHDAALGAEHPDELVLQAHRAVNRRGVAVDLDLARRLLEVDARETATAIAAAEAAGCPGRTLRHSPGLRAWLAEHGLNLPDCTAATVERALAEMT